MSSYSSLVYCLITTALIGCGQSSAPAQTVESPEKEQAPAAAHVLPSRSLQLAYDFVLQQESQEPEVLRLRVEVGTLCADYGKLDFADRLLRQFESHPESERLILSRADLAREMIQAHLRVGMFPEAIAMADRIPPAATLQKCDALARIAVARERLERSTKLDPLWGTAIDFVENAPSRAEKAAHLQVVIHHLLEAGRLEEAKAMARVMETSYSNRQGWTPVAVHFMASGELQPAGELVNNKLIGLDQDLYQFITEVTARTESDSQLALCRQALRKIRNPALAVQAQCVLSGAMTLDRQRSAARQELGRALEQADEGRMSEREKAQILLAAIVPLEVLEGSGAGRQVCSTLKARFAPELAAEGYLKLAAYCRAHRVEDVVELLDTAEELTLKVETGQPRLSLLRRIYHLRGSLAEEPALRSAEHLSSPLDRGSAWLGTASGVFSSRKIETSDSQ